MSKFRKAWLLLVVIALVVITACSGNNAGNKNGKEGNTGSNEAVVAHHQLRFELAHRVDRDADDDQQRGRAQQQRVDAGDLRRDERQDRDDAQEERADQRDPRQAPAAGRSPCSCPGRTPGMNAPWRCRFSGIFCCWKITIV